MFERPQKGERAIIVHVDFTDQENQEDLNEFDELARSAGAQVIDSVISKKDVPEVKYFVGLGKAEEIKQQVASLEVDLVLFNHALSPAQERNLEKLFQCRVLDRTGLILDIFAQRAQSFEGKLQVELAQLQHLSTRLIRGWTHLERQKGGIGLRGPGETQLETDRRLLRGRIKTINKRLAKVRGQRHQGRKARKRALLPTVSLVGYTNAGKSTLFNQLTGSDAYVADKPFATLDPKLRHINLPSAGRIIIADTVGFIRHLPHDLIEAFSATLEETKDASLLLHVIDISDADRKAHSEQVDLVLDQIGAQNVPKLLVYNKIDRLEDREAEIERDFTGKPDKVFVSAAKNLGMELLMKAMSECVFGDPVYRTIILASTEGRLRAILYEKQAVLSERIDAEGQWVVSICLARRDFEALFGTDKNLAI